MTKRMARRVVCLWWFAVCGMACGRTMLRGVDDTGGTGGAVATGGSNVASGGTAFAGSGFSGGFGGFAGSTNGGFAGSTNGGFAGSTNGGFAGSTNGGFAGSTNGGFAGASSGAGGAGSGGAAGSDDVLGCDGLPISPPATACERFEALGFTGVESPNPVSLVPVRSDGSCVSAITQRSGALGSELAALTFMPWKHWPTDNPLGPLTKIPLSDAAPPRFTAAPSDSGRIALAWQNTDGALWFGWDLEPERFAGTYLRVDGTRSYASATAALGHLLLTSDAFGLAIRAWASPPSTAYSNHQSTCADGELSADVEPFGDGFLIASSTGDANVESDGCPHYPDFGGPPTMIVVSELPAVCCSTLVEQWNAGGVVTGIRTAPHPDGIWVVWRTDDGKTPVLRRARVDPERAGALAYEMIGEDWAVPGAFDAVIFGSRLAVVWVDSFAGVHQIRVTMIGNDGSVEDFTPGLSVGGPLEELSVVAGPEGTGLVLGFQNGQLRRLDCKPAF